jgi:hypothetical protein
VDPLGRRQFQGAGNHFLHDGIADLARGSRSRIDFPPERVAAAGNTALFGAKLTLFSLDSEDGSYVGVRRRIEHLALNADPSFRDVFVEELAFPQARPKN